MKRQLTKLLNITGINIKGQKQLENTLILELENNSRKASCPRCKKISYRLHQNHYSLIKDIPWGKTDFFLRVNRRQFKCDNCLKPFSEELDFVKKRQKHTERYAKFITEQVVNSDLKSVAKRNNLTESEIESTIGADESKNFTHKFKLLEKIRDR